MRSVWGFCLIVGLMLLAGCGDGEPSRIPVTGTVTFDGEPVTEGTVTFFSRSTGVADGAPLNSEGRFEFADGLPAGEYVVSVAPPPPEEVAGAPSAAPPKEYPDIPQKYRSDVTTDLKATVEEGSSEPLRFELSP